MQKLPDYNRLLVTLSLASRTHTCSEVKHQAALTKCKGESVRPRMSKLKVYFLLVPEKVNELVRESPSTLLMP